MEDLKFKTAEQVMNNSNKEGNLDFFTNKNKGFAMAINGYRISVQWGSGNYVDDSDVRYAPYGEELKYEIWQCNTAEVLIWDETGRFVENAGACLFNTAPWSDELDEYDFEWCNKVQGGHNDQVFSCCSSECVARMISTLVSCGDSDPRPAIAQIYQASFKAV